MTALDTNVLIYACDKADPKRQKIALELIASATDGVLLWQVACEFIAASRKLNEQGFTPTEAWERLTEFLRFSVWSCRPRVCSLELKSSISATASRSGMR